jgi:hypothetical protein
MDSAAAAVMILLSCSPGRDPVCRPIDTAPTIYSSVDECQSLMMDRLAKSPDGQVVGRCREVDQTVTGSLPAGHTMVIVTRGVGSDAATTYVVPRAADH